MAITQTLQVHDIIGLATAYDRMDNFGYDGWKKLFEYMENLSEEMNSNIELDIVAWCCQYNMCESVDDFWNQYSNAMSQDQSEWDEMDDEEKLEAIEEYLNDNTSVVCCEDDCIIFGCF